MNYFARKYERHVSTQSLNMSALSRQFGLHWVEKVNYNEETGWQISELSDPPPELFSLFTGYNGKMLSLADKQKSCKKG